MIFKRIFLLALFLFLADFFVACCRCEQPPLVEYKRCELDIYNMKYSDGREDYLYSDSVEASDFGIQLLFRQSENTCQLNASGLFVNTAMACSCDDAFGKALDRYESIEIYTIQAFDSIHPAGSKVTEYFNVTNVFPDVSTIADYVAFANKTYSSESNYYGNEMASIRLTSYPDSVSEHQFKVEATMNDGRVLSEITNPVVIY